MYGILKASVLRLFVIYSIISLTFCNEVSNSTNETFIVKCKRQHEYDDLDVRTILGEWKALVVYMHLLKTGVVEYQTCPIITIWQTGDKPLFDLWDETSEAQHSLQPSTENQLYHVQHLSAKVRQEYRNLRLLWDEHGNSVEFSLYFRNDSAGYWQVFDGQNGTLTRRPDYNQFTGTVQVLKAVNDHLLLNFCQEQTATRPAQLYSVLFSRTPGYMERWELNSVHNLLQNKNLSIASRRLVCGNGAERPIYSLVFSLILCLISLIIKSD